MIFKSKKAFEEAVSKEVDRRYQTETHKFIYEVEVGDMPKKEVESYLEKMKQKFTDELKLEPNSFVLVAVENGVGHINITYVG